MRFLFYMNMPSGGNDLIHQVIGEVDCKSLTELRDIMERQDFLTINHLTYDRQPSGGKRFRSRGEMILNTSHIGKVAAYYEG